MAVSKQVADAYKNHFGVDVIGDTVESPVLPSGSAEAIISPSKIGAEAAQSTKKVPPVEMPKLPTFSSVSKSAFTPQGNAEYDPSQGVGYDYTKQSKLLSDTELQDAIRKQDIKDSGAYSPSPSEPMKALNTELSSRNAEKQRIIDQNDMLKRKLNFQARQKELGVSALDEAASYVGTSKFTDMTGTDYLNPLFYAAKAADTVITAHKAVAQGAISAVGTLGASIDLNAGDNIVGDFGEAVSDYAKIIKQKYPQLNPSKNIGGWSDPEFYVKGISEMVPNLLGGMAASMAGAAVGGAATVNPLGAVAGGIAGATSFGYAMESGNIYDDLITRGYSPSSAESGSKVYGAIAALPEAFFHIRGIGSAIVHPMMQEVLKKGMQAEVKQTLFTGAKELVKKGVKKSGGAIIEGTTEAMQQLAQNTVTKFYDKNQNIFDGLAESFVFGMGSGAVVEAGQNFGQRDINKEVVTSLQTEKALQQAAVAAEQLQKTYPRDKDIAGLVLKTKTELKNAQVQTKILDAQFVQKNTTPVVQNEVLDATVSKNIDGKFIATFDTTVDGQNTTFVSQQLHPTEQAAQLEVAQKTQDWLTKQVDSGTVTNIEQATQLNDTLKEIISPKVETPIVETTTTDKKTTKKTIEVKPATGIAGGIGSNLPPHLQDVADRFNASNQKGNTSISNVTPKGYGITNGSTTKQKLEILKGENVDTAMARKVGYQIDNGVASLKETPSGWEGTINGLGDNERSVTKGFNKETVIQEMFKKLYPEVETFGENKFTTTQDPLIEEAKKYKSVEEFVKSKMVDAKGSSFVYQKNTPNNAYTFAEDGHVIKKGDLVKEYMNGSASFVEASTAGKVGKIVTNQAPYLVITPQTKQQLTDIYNKAQGENVKTESIRRQDLEKSQIELTKKYNTAEDFDNAIDTVGYGNFEIPEIKKHIIINTEGSINIRAAEEKMLEGGNTYFLTKIDPTNLVLDAPNKLAIDNLKNKSSINSDTPIVIGNNGYVIDGNHRAYRALQEGKKIYAYLPGKEFWKRWNTDFYGAANIADTANIKKQENTDVYNKAQGENVKTESKPGKEVKGEKKVTKEDKQFVSRVSERMAAEFGTEKVIADKININEESKKAVDLVLKDKDKAYRVAMGIDDVSLTEQTFVNNALYMRAVEEGNLDLANKLIKKGSMNITDAAQAMNAAKASVSDNSARKFLQELMLTRFLMANEKYTADIQDKQEKTTPTQRVKKMVKKDVDSIKNYIKDKKVFDIKQAQDFISSLQCK